MEEATALAIASEWWSSLPYLERAALIAQFGLELYPLQTLLASGALLTLYTMTKAKRGQAQHEYYKQKIAARLGVTSVPTKAPIEAPVVEPTQTPTSNKRLRTSPPTISARRNPQRTTAPVLETQMHAVAIPAQLPVISHGRLWSEIVPLFGVQYPRRRRFRRRY